MSNGLFNLNDKVAVVTGAGRGIGRTLALGLGRHGADVVVVSRTAAEIEEVAHELSAMGRRSLALAADTSRKADVERMVSKTVDSLGRIDVLVNNAAMSLGYKSAMDFTEPEWETILGTNLTGYFLTAQAVGRRMLAQRSGSVVMNSSIAGSVAIAGLAPNASAKGGVNQLVRTLALEWAPYGVRVNALSPGYIRGPSIRTEKMAGDARERFVNSRTPLGRRGEPEELVGPCVFLASAASSYVTGIILAVDGGWTAS